MARVLKLFLHFHLAFTAGITFNYLIKVTLQQSSCHVLKKDKQHRLWLLKGEDCEVSHKQDMSMSREVHQQWVRSLDH